LGVGNDPRYTPTSTFETFPFPEGLTPDLPAESYREEPRACAIADAARRLDDLRSKWLNPPDLIHIEPEVVPGFPQRILPKDTATAAKLRERTLTKLYNERPQWLIDAHSDLDAAVAAAYGWPADISNEDALAELLALNLSRSGTEAAEAGEAVLLGREAFEKISEVEGIRLSASMKRQLSELDREGRSDDEKRRFIAERLRQTTR
jgi:hypothetical protein